MAGQCVSLKGSTMCQAWNQSSVSTSAAMIGMYPFLAFVSDVDTFDTQMKQYIATSYSQQKYQQLLGCSKVDLTNTTNIYARYTASYLCNAIIQNSITPCTLTGAGAMPMCADSCAAFATSEETIAASPDLCDSNSQTALDMIRADFTNCALPPNSLTPNCVHGAVNEPDNCGFLNNVPSLCSYCATSSPNATDSCCLFAETGTRCVGVHLPITTTMGTLFPSASHTANGTAPAHKGLSGGSIAGIVIGSILGAILLLTAIIGACVLFKRRRERHEILRDSPVRARAQQMTYASPVNESGDLPQGARVHQMLALEGSSVGDQGSPIGGYVSSSAYDDTPESNRSGFGIGVAPKRGGSISRPSDYVLDSSPNYGSSPEGMASGQSEQMSQFKDYYSNDDIRTGDLVATLWAYQPRAGDEWELERGDMLKIVGIWDDGWATGYRMNERFEDWELKRNPNRDSGVSHVSVSKTGGLPGSGEVPKGEIKAFPLVCVCLPQHWRKTIEGDTAAVDLSGSGGGSGEGATPVGSP